MTDSGSFDAGDILYGADVQNLYDLVAATCSAGGVSGPSQARTAFAAGTTLTAALLNDLVAAYQRAWDASANKPGTRQSQVSAGGTLYGSLFQNMWTQLGQMTFAQSWADWSETSEAALQTSNIFVALMENPTANGNEEGQGAGLSGADLLLTRGGTVNGATGSPPRRHLASGYFTPTTGLVSAILNTGAAWSFVFKLSDFAGTGDEELLRFCTANGQNEIQLWRMNQKLAMAANRNGAALGPGVVYTANNLPTSGIVYAALWFDGSYIRCGFSTAKPTSWSALAAGNRAVMGNAGGAFSGIDWASTYNAIFAGSSGGSIAVTNADAHYVVTSRNSSLIGA